MKKNSQPLKKTNTSQKKIILLSTVGYLSSGAFGYFTFTGLTLHPLKSITLLGIIFLTASSYISTYKTKYEVLLALLTQVSRTVNMTYVSYVFFELINTTQINSESHLHRIVSALAIMEIIEAGTFILSPPSDKQKKNISALKLISTIIGGLSIFISLVSFILGINPTEQKNTAPLIQYILSFYLSVVLFFGFSISTKSALIDLEETAKENKKKKRELINELFE